MSAVAAGAAGFGAGSYLRSPTSSRPVPLSVRRFFVNCVNISSRGCHGGSSYEAFALAHTVGAVDSSCLPYFAYNMNCTPHNVCRQNLDGCKLDGTLTLPLSLPLSGALALSLSLSLFLDARGLWRADCEALRRPPALCGGATPPILRRRIWRRRHAPHDRRKPHDSRWNWPAPKMTLQYHC